MGGDTSTTMCLLLTLSSALRSPQTGFALPVSEQMPYWEVYPQLSSSDGRRLTPQEVVGDPPSHLQLSLVINGTWIHMKLQQNRHLTPDFHTLSFYLPDGTRVTENRSHQMSCYYQGRLAGRSGPWSSLSLCSGLRGILALEQQYSMEPVLGDPSFKHILRPVGDHRNITCETRDAARTSTNHKPGRTLLSMGDPQSDQEELALPHLAGGAPDQVQRSWISETKYVELVMVADNSEYELYRRDLNALHTRILEIANRMDAFYRTVNIRVILVGVEVWNQKDQITVSSDPAETLNHFLSWREKELLRRIHHDNAQLLTGVTFQGSAVGMATVDSICTADCSGGVSMDHSVSILGVASTVAHELGHNLGLNHNAVDGKCGQPSTGKYWIMEQGTRAGYMPGLEFSNCSRSELDAIFKQGGGKCLFNVPSPSSVFGQARCGNLVVEKGEECDCGLTQECTDPCCNASTCQLVAGAECASDGLCCEQCKIQPLATLCRPPLGDCDLPEYCNGVSPHCPANTYLQDGETCARGQAHCYKGECRTLKSQCQSVWGPGSSPAPEACFKKVNMRGDRFGSCGRRTNGTYLPCSPRNALCGTIQCQGGNDQPLVGSGAKSVTVKVTVNGTEVSCRGTNFNMGDDIWDPVLVKTGTVCGLGKVCVDQRCQDVAVLKALTCTNNCNGHGVCNSNSNCHCDRGWAPPDCGRSGDGGSVDSGPMALERGGGSISTTIILIVLLLLVVIILVVFCYVKRVSLQRKISGLFSNGSKCQYRVTQNSSELRPQRPPPPHWTQSTELQVMSASNQDYSFALPAQSNIEGYDRPDPPSKPLPPDPVPRPSQADPQERPPAPNRPLPADPRQAKVSLKPPLPKKPLPVKPTLPCQDPLLSVPTYPERIIALPSRQAPPPPYSGWSPRA
ncbi:PREDICTED: disintegrin and metalloproteinase domain-containing protein 15 [Nanorana parkeri]|uniref:disintegrin and metalloproteinase domain-containing protein 15 n=1 Tax=Nanorana parkeri TaxID=125878 RepID=UPI000854F646|nr:PREDICTED: disintegrin and metalloproteinase domain-containing protein 15 [Nanorana parkeri]